MNSHNRLLIAVLDRPTLIGVGVDEGTAVFLIGARLDVAGSSAVVVVDARKSESGEAGARDSQRSNQSEGECSARRYVDPPKVIPGAVPAPA